MQLIVRRVKKKGASREVAQEAVSGDLIGIQEAKDCTPEQLKINEFNSGIYCFNTPQLLESITKLQTNNTQNEYYLTDVIKILYNNGHTISGHCIDTVYEILGANTQEELDNLNKQAEKLFSQD